MFYYINTALKRSSLNVMSDKLQNTNKTFKIVRRYLKKQLKVKKIAIKLTILL